ncbi:MAG: ribose 5-phosphate isomerase A [Pyrobaculum sp.]
MSELKKRLANEALRFVKSGMVLGLGSGTTAREFIKALGAFRHVDFVLVATSIDSELAVFEVGLGDRLRPMWAVDRIDLAVDGADEVTRDKIFLKGRGGALVREKVVDYAAETLVILVEEFKIVDKIPKRSQVAIEVLPWAWRYVAKKIVERYGGEIWLRQGQGRLGPVVSDNGNYILDWGPPSTVEPSLEDELKAIPGVIDTGLFTRRRDAIVLAAGERDAVYQLST